MGESMGEEAAHEARVRGEVAIRDASPFELLVWLLIASVPDDEAREVAERVAAATEASGRAEAGRRGGGSVSVDWSKATSAHYTVRWAGES